MSNEVIVFLTGFLPIAEGRVAIPLGLGLGLTPIQAFLFGIAGTILLTPALLWFFQIGVHIISAHIPVADRFFTWLFAHTQEKYADRFTVISFIALVLFVAVPLPVTGTYTASLVASIFKVSFKESLLAIWLGLLISGVVILGISLGVIAVF